MSEIEQQEPSVTNIELTSLPDSGDAATVDSTVVTLHEHVLHHVQQGQRHLLSLKTLPSLVRFLLEGFPGAFGSVAAELRLHDPDGQLATLLPTRNLYAGSLNLHRDSYSLYQLYPDTPSTVLLDLGDERMFRLLSGANDATGAVVMPLYDGNRLIGSYHLALVDGMTDYGEAERGLFVMLAQLISAAMLRVVEAQRADQLSMLDPVTEVANLRAFRRDMLREIYWARRVNQPLSLLYVGLDDIDEVGSSYGEVASHFVQRRISQRLCSDLRATDYIAHISPSHFAILLPGCNEPHAHDIGERMRADIDDFPMDDGRGAVLYVSLSVGLVCWEPARHPMDDTERLAAQIEAEAESAVQKSERAGGNRVSVSRLGLLMV